MHHCYIYFNTAKEMCEWFDKHSNYTLISHCYDSSKHQYMAIYKGFQIGSQIWS